MLKIKRLPKAYIFILLAVVLAILIVYATSDKDMVQFYEENPDWLEHLAAELCSMQEEDPVIIIRKWSWSAWDDTCLQNQNFSDSLKAKIAYLFHKTNCKEIVVNDTYEGSVFCQFSDGGYEVEKGLVYTEENERNLEEYKDALFGVYGIDAYYVDTGWIYYDATTEEAYNRMPG